MKPRLLNGCAKSKYIADAFEAMGWDAWTCDILPAEGNQEYHIQDDVLNHLDDGWDVGIFHPDCTYIANSGVRWLHERLERWDLLIKATEFFNKLCNAPMQKICVENPIPHKYARELIGIYDQIIQPWQFGEPYTKATCLWLKGLPPLMATKIIPKAERYPSVWLEPPSTERKANRSRTYKGIADAMAEQWGGIK
ncbi:hypothetical protein LCGC14_0917300 [marine sediment metagenome]|uniref:DNA cytosine methyltransferase n=1 Tax=marine sediment metagenome TaxID=412755 RepID=A0A0F9NWL6_9ZZZZ